MVPVVTPVSLSRTICAAWSRGWRVFLLVRVGFTAYSGQIVGADSTAPRMGVMRDCSAGGLPAPARSWPLLRSSWQELEVVLPGVLPPAYRGATLSAPSSSFLTVVNDSATLLQSPHCTQ